VKPGSEQWFQQFYEVDVTPEAVARWWHDDVVVEQERELLDTAGTFRGHEGIIAMLAELGDSFERIDWSPEEIHDLGDDRYLVRVHIKVVGRGSGIEQEADIGHVLRLHEGRVHRMEVYRGWDEARRAAGLS
jgi:ketosteroid isomerase-like protein